jgi:acetoin utilization deacetylase AcuC-like enzyme
MLRIYQHDDCLAHDPGPSHPENAGRLRAILTALHKAPFHARLDYAAAPLGSEDHILLAHDTALLELVKASAPTAGRCPLDADTVMSPGTLEAALRGVGAVCRGVDELLAGTITQGFCLTRPPGHHATPSRAMGFCVFNQVAIAALYARQAYGLERVAIVDFDVHHGNGTQEIVTGREGLLYLSTHQSPLYPGSGSLTENRPGNICNLPLPSGTDDATYQRLFSTTLLPELEAFRPQLLLVSAGFDGHSLDQLASFGLSEASYTWLGRELRRAAEKYSNGRLLSVLEGGYNLEVLGQSVVAYLQGMLDEQ